MPWYVKAVAAGLVAFAFSPIDLIPDFIPVLGYLDDLVVIPLGVLFVRRCIPAEVWADCRARAGLLTTKPVSRVGAAIVVGLWFLVAGLTGWLISAGMGGWDGHAGQLIRRARRGRRGVAGPAARGP